MNKINLMMGAGFLVTGLIACKTPLTKSKQDVMNLSNYIDSIKGLTPDYTAANWAILSNGFNARVAEVNNNLAQMEATDKAKIEESKIQYAALKKEYELKINEAAMEGTSSPDYRTVLRNSLFGEGVVGSDMNFSFATASNLLSIFRNFVNTVDANKNKYTREDWDEIKVLYEGLDSRKNSVEKELPKGDNGKIGGLKLKFGLIKATHRGGAKAKENKEAKEKS